MKKAATLKADRVLYIYMRLLHKRALAKEFHVTVRSIQRDISVLRFVLAEQRMGQYIISEVNGYRLQNILYRSPENL